MLQWLPGSDREVMWNDREGDRFVCRVHDVKSGKTRTLGAPVYTLSPDGKTGLAPDFRRLNDCRPGYGYAGLRTRIVRKLAPTQTGLWKIDMRTGAERLLFDFASVAKIPHREAFSRGAKHWFNHLLFNTDGSRFIFLHRWRGEKEGRVFRRGCLRRGRTGVICMRWTRGGRRRISSGGTRRRCWPGRGILHTGRRSTCTRTRPRRWK